MSQQGFEHATTPQQDSGLKDSDTNITYKISSLSYAGKFYSQIFGFTKSVSAKHTRGTICEGM